MKLYEHTCQQCFGDFESDREYDKFCSDFCEGEYEDELDEYQNT